MYAAVAKRHSITITEKRETTDRYDFACIDEKSVTDNDGDAGDAVHPRAESTSYH